jgi:hypothetical protein
MVRQNTMERDVFDWEQWDCIDVDICQYYNITLNIPVGNFPIGEVFDSVCTDYQNGFFEFYRNNEVVGKFKIKLNLEEVTE